MTDIRRGDRVRPVKPTYVFNGMGTVRDVDHADYVAVHGVPQLTVDFGGRKVQVTADQVTKIETATDTAEAAQPATLAERILDGQTAQPPQSTVAERILSRILRYEAINPLDDGGAALHRWIIFHSKRTGRGIYIHKFAASERGRAPHDHPKPFLSIGLLGSYIEASMTPEHAANGKKATLSRYVAPWVRRFGPNHIHRIRLPGHPPTPCWTLAVTGRKKADWGFWSRRDATGPRHKIPEAEYHRQEAADASLNPQTSSETSVKPNH